MSNWAVVLAGGVGSRFWPLSTPSRPKQLLSLVGRHSLLVDTLARLAPLVPADRTLVLTNAALVDAIAAAAPDVPRANIIAEPRPAGTTAALAYAATEILRRDDDDAVMLCVHADWSVGNPDAFRRRLAQAADLATRHHAFVTVGIVPSRAETGYGYIQPGDVVEGDARKVVRFVEKPDRLTAERMVRDGYLWNSGIFVWRAADLVEEIRALTPEVAPALDAGSTIDRFFATAKAIAVDIGVLERSARVMVLPGDFEWDDVGTWASLRRVRALDHDGNASSGDVHAVQARGNVVHAEGGTVVLYGVSDLVVVARHGLTVVTTVEKAADLKALVEALPASVRDRP